MASEAITQPVSQCFPDNSGVKRLLARVLRREGGLLTLERGERAILFLNHKSGARWRGSGKSALFS